jgi:hypothetical protein
VLDKFPKYYTKILLGDFNAKLGTEYNFKPTVENESLHKINCGNGVRVVNFTTSKNLLVKGTIGQHRNIHKYTWMSPDWKTHNQIDPVLIGEGVQVHLISDHAGQQIVILTTVWLWQIL